MGNAHKKLGFSGDRKSNPKREAAAAEPEINEKVLEDIMRRGAISDHYEVYEDQVLGRGHYAIVNLGRNKHTGQQVAVKRIQIAKSRIEALQREVEVLQRIDKHPNIITLYDIYITETELQLVLELLQGGELFDRMVEKGPYSELEASHHILKIGRALKYLHRHGIVHRDLKPENLILANKNDDSELKIADFGLSKIVENVQSATLRTVCGTWAYCAPEVKTSMKGGQAAYSAAVDLWSVGVILYVILGAYHPFDPDGDATDDQLWDNICKGEFDFDDPAWETISAQAKDLIKKLIVVDPVKRYTTDDLLNHPWVTKTASVPATPITPSIDKSLINYVRNKNKSKITALGNSTGNVHQSQMHGLHAHQVHHQVHQVVGDGSSSNVNVSVSVMGSATSHNGGEGQRVSGSEGHREVCTDRLDKGSKMEIDGGNGLGLDDDKGEGIAPPLPSLTLNTLIPESNKPSSVGTDSQDVYMDVSG